jgi:hypothetical protein
MNIMAFFTASIEPIKVEIFLKKCVHFCTNYWLEALNNCAEPFCRQKCGYCAILYVALTDFWHRTQIWNLNKV